MFDRDNEPTQAHAPSPQEQFDALVPPLKTLKVLRHRLPDDPKYREQALETLYIDAHSIGISDDNRTVFQVWRMNGLAGPHLEVVRMLTGVVDIEETGIQTGTFGKLIS